MPQGRGAGFVCRACLGLLGSYGMPRLAFVWKFEAAAVI